MNVYLINKPSKIYLKDEKLYIHSKDETVSVKVSEIENIVAFDGYKLPEDVLEGLKSQAVYSISQDGRIIFYRQPKLKLKKLEHKYNLAYASAIRTVKSIFSYSKIYTDIKHTASLDAFYLGKEIDVVDQQMIENQNQDEFSQSFLSSLIYRTNQIFTNINLFSKMNILYIHKSKSLLENYNFMFSFLTIFINHHLHKSKINPFQNIVLKRKVFGITDKETIGDSNYPDATIILMFPFCMTLYDLVKKIIIGFDVSGQTKIRPLLLLKHFNHRFTYNYGNVTKMQDIIRQIVELSQKPVKENKTEENNKIEMVEL